MNDNYLFTLNSEEFANRLRDIDREHAARLTELHKEFAHKIQDEKTNRLAAYSQLAQQAAMNERLIISTKSREHVNHVERDGLRDRIKMFMAIAKWLREQVKS